VTAFASVDAQKRVQRAEDDGRDEHEDDAQESPGNVEGGAQTKQGKADEEADGAIGKADVGLHEWSVLGSFGIPDDTDMMPSSRGLSCSDLLPRLREVR
jgi:hypothetical protein